MTNYVSRISRCRSSVLTLLKAVLCTDTSAPLLPSIPPSPPLVRISAQVDASLSDVDAAAPHLLDLLAPAGTVMDLNIGAALWLAARGVGTLSSKGPHQATTTISINSSSSSTNERENSDSSSSSGSVSHQRGCGGGSSSSSCGATAAAVNDNGDATASSGQAALATARASEELGAVNPYLARDADAATAAAAAGVEGAAGEARDLPPPAPPLYCSAASVVLLGHGADEQAGGYGRHRTKFQAHGWQGLAAELQVDMQRLWFRNLGRDDRLIADHGRESRHPFLDEQLVELMLGVDLGEVVDLRGKPGGGGG